MTAQPFPRPAVGTKPQRREAQPNGGRLGLLRLHTIIALRSSLRTVEFAVGAVVIPVMLYAMIGLPNAANELPNGTSVGATMLVSICSFGVISLAIFTFGEYIAKERGRGWTRTLMATPFPTGIYLLGKSLTAMVHAGLIALAMGLLAATAGGVEASPSTWLLFGATMVAGVVVFSTLGFAIAYLAQPKAATTISNMVFLPLSFASGFFMPLSQFPDVVASIAEFLPTFHFGQIAYRVFMPVADIEAWTGVAPQPFWVHATWVIGSSVLFGVAAVWAARREAVARRG